MIIGTAGHIDHGKTSLVKALTGIDTDRLKEEQRRGITIELGFAHLALPDGSVAGVVDVPGHERFVKAMAAGAGGVDLALLVVAADEGVMPQTREHLDICSLLGVRAGVVALTKADLLADLGDDWLAMLKADLAALTRGTFLESAPVVPVCAKSGQGLTELVAALAEKAHDVPHRNVDGPLFLPIDRVFSVKGFGTVVTGTLLSGQLAVEDEVSLAPSLAGPFRVRGLQTHGQARPRLSAGERCAANLTGVEPSQVERGMAVVRHGELLPAQLLDVELTALPALERGLPRRSKLLLHLGTDQVEATVALLDLERLPPGQTGLAQLRLGRKVAALADQRFILRGNRALEGRGATVAGGRVLSLSPTRRRKGAAQLLAPLRDAGPEARVTWLLEQAGYKGLLARELFVHGALPQKVLSRALELATTRGAALLVDKEKRLYLAASVFGRLQERALALLAAFHQREPSQEGLGKEELRQRLGVTQEKVWLRLLAALLESGKVQAAGAGGERLRLSGQGGTLSATEQTGKERLLADLTAARLAPPTVNELATRHHLAAPKVVELLKLLVRDGSAAKVSDELYFARTALDELQARLVEHLTSRGELTTQGFKELTGQSRKFVIPLSEYFDREKVTLRVGEKRVLRRRSS